MVHTVLLWDTAQRLQVTTWRAASCSERLLFAKTVESSKHSCPSEPKDSKDPQIGIFWISNRHHLGRQVSGRNLAQQRQVRTSLSMPLQIWRNVIQMNSPGMRRLWEILDLLKTSAFTVPKCQTKCIHQANRASTDTSLVLLLEMRREVRRAQTVRLYN